MSKKDKMADGAHRRLCMSHGPASIRPIFAGRGLVILGLLATGWKSFWNEHKLVAWSYQPSIFTQNDCLNTVFSDVVSLHGSCRNKLPSDNPHWKNFNLSCNSLSACKKSFLTRKEIFMQVDRSIK